MTARWLTTVGSTAVLIVLLATGANASGGIGTATCGSDVKIAYSPTILWPPNHKLTTVTIHASDKDAETGTSPEAFSVTVSGITDNQDEAAGGECGEPGESQGSDFSGVGNTASGMDPGTVVTSVQLRSERCAPEGTRVYDIHVSCVDEGSATPGTADLLVTVPKDRSAK